MIELYANNAQTTIAAAINNTVTTVQLSPGSGSLFPAPSAGQFFRMTFVDVLTGLLREIVYCTSRSGDNCTIQRGQEGTTALSWNIGDFAANLPTSGSLSNLIQAQQLQNSSATYAPDTGSANAYAASYTPAVTSLGDGSILQFKAAHSNTGASTFAPNGIGTSPIVNVAGNALVGGEIPTGAIISMKWNSTIGAGSWVLIGVEQLSSANGTSLIGSSQSGAGAATRTAQAKLNDILADEDYTTLQGTINIAGSLPRAIEMGGRTSTQVSIPTNTYGTPFSHGKVLVPSLINGYNTQLNTYADIENGLMVARENLAAFWLSCTAGTAQSVYVYGDSTVQNDGSYPLKSTDLMQLAFYSAGINNALTVNRGVSGTSWSDLSTGTDLGASTKLIVIKYGINDAVKANALSTLASDARTKLTAIRAATNGDFDNLSILLMGPNSTYRPSTGQDAKWYEDLRNIYVQLCKEFDCAYFDTYAYLQQTKHAPGLWMDNIGGSGEGLHPNPTAVYWIWFEGFLTNVLGNGQWNTQKSNQFWNIANATRAAFPTSQPQTYYRGITVESGLATNGWPFDGILVTIQHADGLTVQTLSSNETVPRTAKRCGTGLTWGQWTGVPALIGVGSAPTFSNSWVNKGGGYASAGYQVGADGFVELFGVISSGTAGAAAFTLPTSARPAAAHIFYAPNAGTVTVFSNGTVIPNTSDTTLVSLDGMRFKVL